MSLNLNQFEALTFDCYGTLIDWETGILAVLRPLAVKFESKTTDEALLELYGELESELEEGPYLPYREVLRQVLSGIADRLDWPKNRLDENALVDSVQHWPAFSDSAAALGRLKAGYQLCIVSNIDDDLFALSAHKLGVSFDQVITAQQVASYKPNRNNFLQALARIGLGPDKILHVAQSLFHDIEPAQELGLKTVWVNRRLGKAGFGATPKSDARPDLEVSNLQALADLVDARIRGGS